MAEEQGISHVKRITVERQIIRADGTRGPVELVSVYDSDPVAMEQALASGLGEVRPTERLLNMTRDEIAKEFGCG